MEWLCSSVGIRIVVTPKSSRMVKRPEVKTQSGRQKDSRRMESQGGGRRKQTDGKRIPERWGRIRLEMDSKRIANGWQKDSRTNLFEGKIL